MNVAALTNPTGRLGVERIAINFGGQVKIVLFPATIAEGDNFAEAVSDAVENSRTTQKKLYGNPGAPVAFIEKVSPASATYVQGVVRLVALLAIRVPAFIE